MSIFELMFYAGAGVATYFVSKAIFDRFFNWYLNGYEKRNR